MGLIGSTCTGLPRREWETSVTVMTSAEAERRARRTTAQGLTLVHFSAQLEPCLSQGNTLHTLNTP